MVGEYKIFLISFIVFVLTPFATYADIIRVSEDKNINYKKDFNSDGKYVLTIDPGHGGDGNFAHRSKYFYSDKQEDVICEDDIDLYLSTLIKENIEKDGRIEVHMTRDGDTEVSLADRGVLARNFNSDLMISIHFNDMPTYEQTAKAMGCEIWQSVVDMYKPYGLANAMLKEFNKNHFLQTTRGLKERVSGDSYWDYNINDAVETDTGNPADYYGVIKAGARNMVPTIIVEHAFFSNDVDFANMQEQKFYEELAEREARAIISWFTE